MSTQPDSEHHDLDRTDELPRLDVEAYEASLRLNTADADADFGSRTDTWTVAALREIDVAEETQQRETPRRARSFASHAAADVTADVDHILKRIAVLESELAVAKALNVELQSRSESAAQERDEQARAMVALKTDHERLSEHRTLGDEMVGRLEQKLRDQSVQFTTQLTELQSARFAEQLQAEKAREELQKQIAQKAVQLNALQENHSKLRDELAQSVALATERGASVKELRALLVEEETSAEQLALQLASKLRESDSLSSTLDARNHTIVELRTQIDTVNAKLSATQERVDALTSRLEASNQELAGARAQQSERESAMAASRQKLDEVRTALAAAETSVTTLQRELSTAHSALSDEQGRRHAIEEQLQAEQLTAQGLRAGLDFARSELEALSGERDSLLPLRDVVAEKTAMIDTSERQLEEARQTLATLQGEIAARAEDVRIRELEKASALAEVAELRRERDELRRSLEEALRTSERLKGEANSHLQLLHVKTSELAAARQDLQQQAPALRELEQGLRARDELTAQLRNQLQSVQDEHAILSGQLQKARLRVKSLAEQIFHRDNQIAALKSDLSVHVEALAAIRRDVSRVDEEPQGQAASAEPQRVLQPVDHDGDAIVLDRKVITVGRTAENDVCVPSKLISRHHARLLVGPNGVIVEDAGSTNGCFVNGKQIKQQLMRDGDVLEMGDLRYRLHTPPLNDTRARDNVIVFSGK